jgi:hypothetical protein
MVAKVKSTDQTIEHQKTAQLLAWEIGQGEDEEMQRVATETLPTVLEHLRLPRLSRIFRPKTPFDK